MNKNQMIERAQNLQLLGNTVAQSVRQIGYMHGVDEGLMANFRSSSLSFIKNVYGETHSYYTEFKANTNGNMPHKVNMGLGILKAIEDEVQAGWLSSIRGIIAAEVFSDFIEMAEHLLGSGYKDPAAVLAGSVLEDHLKQLCKREEIPTSEEKDGKMIPLKADRLNALLMKAEVYGPLDLKAVTTWLGLRNDAAHGNYDSYTREQVELMIAGIQNFLVRVCI